MIPLPRKYRYPAGNSREPNWSPDASLERMDDNEAIFKRILDDTEFREVLMDLYAARVYRRARERREE